jgi:hypothetical protein
MSIPLTIKLNARVWAALESYRGRTSRNGSTSRDARSALRQIALRELLRTRLIGMTDLPDHVVDELRAS